MSADNSTPRQPCLKLPAFFPWAIGQAIGEAADFDRAEADDYVRQDAAVLGTLAGNLLTPAQVLADPITPRSAQHALVSFRPALDALANYLTCGHGGRIRGFEGEVQPPCDYPMRLQSAIMRLAEAVQAGQDWESAIAEGKH